MDAETKKIIDEYQYFKIGQRKIREYSNKHYFNDRQIYSSTTSNRDIERAYEAVVNYIQYYENFDKRLESDDIDELEKALGRYEITIHKLIACFDNPYCEFNYSADELLRLINDWDEFDKRIKDIHMRRMCQD
jgi:hypothetical protein